MQVRALTHIARAQTNKLIEGSGNGNCVTQTIHIAILTFNIFPFVVIVLFQIQRSVSRTADKHNNKKTKKTLHQELQSQKIKWIFQTCPHFMIFWSSFSLCSCDRAHLECLVELVSLDSLERRSVFPLSDWWFVCGLVCHCVCGVCAWASRSERWEVMQKYLKRLSNGDSTSFKKKCNCV